MKIYKGAKSENRFAKRFLLRKGSRRDEVQMYADCKGQLYEYKFVAKISSFFSILNGCLHNGFPIVCKKLWYNAWACWPFFFVRRDIEGDPVPLLNHERIHVRQQWDIHVSISLPLFILACLADYNSWFSPLWLLCVIPFVPTIVYGVSMVVAFRTLLSRDEDDITFTKIRRNTCFEREANSHQLNADYLLSRKFMAFIAYTNFNIFRNYGQH